MKKFILSFVWILCITLINAQIVPIAYETFDGTLSGWTITPSSSWNADTNLYVSGHTSYKGIVPSSNIPGDTSILTSPVYNLTSYAYAWLQFNQVCKVMASDICQIEYKENNIDSVWKAIPASAYKGNGIFTNAMFNQASYPEWHADDSSLVPTNAWFRTENFDVSSLVSNSQVQFRFKITVGSISGTSLVYGWLIDNFKLIASNNPITPPDVVITSTYGDTVFNTGPFVIEAKVADRTAPLQIAKLYYAATYNNVTTYDSIVMTPIDGDTIWTATIPQHVYGTSIVYTIVGVDTADNSNSDRKGMIIKRLSGGFTGYVIVGTGTNTISYAPMHRYYDYSWSRILYLGSELSATSSGGLITKLAWQVANTCVSGTNQTCYFQEVTDNAISNVAYINPALSGATLVWSGTYDLSTTGWSEITLQTPFVLTSGKNLLIYWENKDGNYASPYSSFNYTTTLNYMTMYDYEDGTFPSYSTPYNGGLDYDRPNARFFISPVSVNYNNSVALHSIDSPLNEAFYDPMNQVPVVVTIKNKGLTFLDSCYINWTLNGIPQPRYTWRGHLPEDFNAQNTIGYYLPKVEGFDTLVIWTSLPNAIQDSLTFDDTLTIISYGKTGLDMSFISFFNDTVYNTGPFTVKALISSRTSVPVPSHVNLNVKYTFNGIDSYDTLLMDNIGNDKFSVVIPQHCFGTNLEYTISIVDSIGNIVSIQNDFYIHRYSGSGLSGYIVIGNGTITNYYTPASMYYNYSWARMLYLASEFSATQSGGFITKLAWEYDNATGTIYSNQTCYFKAVDDTVLTTGYIDPIIDGATEVWSGTLNIAQGWVEITLNTPFLLPQGKHLHVYWHHNNGSYVGSSYYWRHTSTSPDYRTVQAQSDGSFPSGNSGSLYYDRPNARFFFMSVITDSNSVALYSIDSPNDIALADPLVQEPVVVTIKNKGIAFLDSCYINWTLNGIPQPRFTWRGSMPEDFNAQDTIGYYSPRTNQFDTLVVWTSDPNGVYDSTATDDTLMIITYGATGLDMAFVSSLTDTIYHTGPFLIQANIASLTQTPLPAVINLFVKTNYNGIDTYDTLQMNYSGGDMYEVVIPKKLYGMYVEYSITLIDSLGNVCSIFDGFYTKRPGPGYVIIGNGTATYYYTPASMYYNYSWARMLYLASEFNAAQSGGIITKLAWEYDYATGTTYNNQTCYFKAIDDTVLTTGYIDPLINGATQVWSGTLNIAQGWVEITLNTPFLLPPGKHLQVYWHHNDGSYAGDSYKWRHTSTSPYYRTVQAQSDGSFPSGSSGTLYYYRPNARFYVIPPTNDSNSVAIAYINTPGEGSMTGSNPVQITVKNKGMKALDSCTINWTVNGVLQTPYIYRGHLYEDFEDTVTIGNYIQRAMMFDTIVVWVGMPNGVIDTTISDDTLTVVSFGCYGPFSGDFIIGTAPGADVTSINEASLLASKCGINGNITLKLQNGIYTENWDFTNFVYLLGSYSLTITSSSGNRDSVILKPSSGVGITLNNSNNIIIKDITIDNTSSVAYGIQFTGAVDNVEIRNIHFIGNITATSEAAAPAPIYKGSGTGIANNVCIIGNIIEGGYHGVYFYGGTATSDYGTNIIMDSNIIENQYYYANYFYYMDLKSFSHNTILSRQTNTSTYWYGFRFYYCNFIADGNKVLQRSTSISYPRLAYIYYAGYYNAVSPSLFCNNELIGSSTSTYYGMYLGSYNVMNIYNNSIYMSGTGGVRNLYLVSSANSNFDIKNNIMVNASTSGTILYCAGTTTPFASDYNCLYSAGNIGYYSTSRNTLLAWQTATSKDSGSVSINPSFINVSTSLEYVYDTNLIAPQLTGIDHDITGKARSSITSMGAYEYNIKDIELDSIVSPFYQEEFCQNSVIPLTLSISNQGKVDYVFSMDSIYVHLRASGAIVYAKDTTIASGNLLKQQNLNIPFASDIALLNTGIANISVYISHTDANIVNDTVTSTIYINPVYRNYDTLRIGESQMPGLYGDSIISGEGDYVINFTSINYCDSIIDLHVIVDSIYHIMSTVTICDNELPYYIKDSVFTSAGNYDVYIDALVGGDTIIHLTLIVNPTYIGADTLTICDNELPFTYGDSILPSAGSYNIHFNTVLGCDSLVVLKLYVNPTYAHTDTVTICDSELPLTYGDSVLTQAGSYNVHFHTVLGCDSLVIVKLNVNSTYIHSDTVTICDSELPLNYGDSVLTHAGSYNIHFNTILGCDSLVVVQLNVNSTYDHTDTVTICDSELPLNYGDSILANAGNYDIHFNSIHGCDSLIQLTLYVNPTYLKTDTLTICANELPYDYGDSILTQAGDFEVHFNSIHACDSAVNLTLYVKPTSGSNDTITICDSEFPYSYGDSIFNVGGLHQVYYTAVNGCDSVVELTLYVNPTYTKTDTLTICDTELPYTYGDSILIADGSYNIHFASINDCDSLITLRLYVNPSFIEEDTITICDSELPFTYGDSVLTTGGSYDIHFSTINACDSMVVLMLYVNPTYHEAETLEICDSELPYSYGDSIFTEAGDYVIPMVSIYGCDSVINLRLNVITIPTAPTAIYGDTIITVAGNYVYYVDPVEGAQSYEWSISNANWIGTSTTETISINIPDAGTATISVKAVNTCGTSDSTTLFVNFSVNIDEKDGITWSLDQNIPNPASASTLIPYTIPQNGKVVFSVMSINGQSLYREELQVNAGSHYLEMNTQSFSAGIYYYSMEYQGQRIVKKMTIQK